MPTIQCPHCGSGVGVGKPKCPVCYGETPTAVTAADQAAVAPAMPPPVETAQASPQLPTAYTAPPAAPVMPMAAPAPPAGPYNAPLSGMGGGDVRVSLTGEVIASEPYSSPPLPAAAPPPYGVSQPTAAVRPGPTAPIPPRTGPASRYATVRPVEPTRRGMPTGLKVVLGLVGAFVVLGAVVVGGLVWFGVNRILGAQVAADRFLAASKSRDWHTVYTLIYFDAATKDQLGDSVGEPFMTAGLAKAAEVKQMTDYKILGTVPSPEGANVSVLETATLLAGSGAGTSGQTTEVFPMVNHTGSWQVDFAALRALSLAKTQAMMNGLRNPNIQQMQVPNP